MNDKIIVYDRLKEVVPVKSLEELDCDEVKVACRVAFEIIGYDCDNLDDCILSAWKSSSSIGLADFIFDVWEVSAYG